MPVAPSPVHLPRLRHADIELVRWAEDLVRALERELAQLRSAAGQSGYTPANVTEARSLDTATATTSTLAHLIGTVILDLQRKGILA